MATLADILQQKWPGAHWKIDGDDFRTLAWYSKDVPKPTEADIRAFAAEVDAAVADKVARETAERKFLADNPDAVLKLAEVTFKGFEAVYRVLSGAQRTALQADTDFQALVAARARLAQIRGG